MATEIKSATVARGVDKLTHETFYVVKSDHCETTWYTVRWNNERLMWCCNCPATCSGCKHHRAVCEVLRLRRIRIAAAMGGETPAIVERLQAREDARKAQEPYADRLHNGVSLDKFNADVERENSEAALERRIAERDAERTAYNRFALSMGI